MTATVEWKRVSERVVLDGTDCQITYPDAMAALWQDREVELFVDGWQEPWTLFLDGHGKMRGICPTAPKVRPEVVRVAGHTRAPPSR